MPRNARKKSEKPISTKDTSAPAEAPVAQGTQPDEQKVDVQTENADGDIPHIPGFVVLDGVSEQDAAVLMATSPKSNSGHIALDAALEDVRKGRGGDFPRHLQNMHADSYSMEREQGYLYPHDFPNHWVQQQYLPDDLVGTTYYEYGPNKTEQAAKAYWDAIKGK